MLSDGDVDLSVCTLFHCAGAKSATPDYRLGAELRGMGDTKTGSNFTADVSGAQYRVDKGNIDTGIGGLPSTPNFPFDASTVHAGQRVELESVSSLNGNSLVAEKVNLSQQTLSGTISGLSGTAPTTFTLAVASDSAFAMLSGSNIVTIYLATWHRRQQSAARPHEQ